jgi:chorismate mutase/prephenate dehydratase
MREPADSATAVPILSRLTLPVRYISHALAADVGRTGNGGASRAIHCAMPDMRLQRLRAELDAIDRRIVEALADRLRVVGVISAFKETQPDQIRDRAREEELLQHLQVLARDLRLDAHFVTRLFREILDYSLRRQEEHLLSRARGSDVLTVIACQGTEGTWSHIAAMRHFGVRSGDVEYRPFDTFREMLETVRSGVANFAMLPIENTTAGSMNETYDLLAQMDVAVVGEEIQRIDHCLVAMEAVPLERVKRILADPQAIEQCAGFLAGLPHCQVESLANVALAARRVRQDQDLSQAAIASDDAARRSGLTVIARDIMDQRENYTRFVVVGPRLLPCDSRIPCKTSLIFTTKHEEGALVSCLNVLASHGLSLTKLESRPRPGSPWEYVFYVDFEGNLDDPATERALRELAAHVVSMKVLGCYPARMPKTDEPLRAG